MKFGSCIDEYECQFLEVVNFKICNLSMLLTVMNSDPLPFLIELLLYHHYCVCVHPYPSGQRLQFDPEKPIVC